MLRKAQPDDLPIYAQYVLIDGDDKLTLIEWTPEAQQHWADDHPGSDVWTTLGEDAVFSQPYQTADGKILIPTSQSYDKSLEIMECHPKRPYEN